MDYLWYGEQNAYKLNYKITTWLISSTNNNVNNIVSGYKLDGTKLVGYSNAAFVGPFGVGSMLDVTFQDWCNALYNRLRSFSNGGAWGYYQDCLKMLTMLTMTGNFFNFAEEQTGDFAIPTCQILSPIEDSIISGDANIIVSANSEKYNLDRIKLLFNDTEIYNTNLSSKCVILTHRWDTTSIIQASGTIKAIVYDTNGSSYTYSTNVQIAQPSIKLQDGTGKVIILPTKVSAGKCYDFVLTYTAQDNISLGEILIELPNNIEISSQDIKVYSKYGSPVISNYNYTNHAIKINILKIYSGESICIELNNTFVSNTLGRYNFTVKTKTNGGILKEIVSQPYIEVYALNEKVKTKLLSLNKDYRNDVIVFDSKNVLIFDSKGRKVVELKNSNVWDGKDSNGKLVSNGIYFYKSPNGENGKIIVVR